MPVHIKKMNKARKHSAAFIFNRYGMNYLFILPGIVLLVLFAYVPMFGILIAFQDFRIYLGVLGSEWNSFANFEFIRDAFFWFTVKNTIILTFFR